MAKIYNLEMYRLFKQLKDVMVNNGLKINFDFQDPFFEATSNKLISDEINWAEYCLVMSSYSITRGI